MWGKPIEKIDENGQKISIIFLDSEGLFSSNISETYDAKIFAITALLSSQLIYNSVRFIDQSAIDYIEYYLNSDRFVDPSGYFLEEHNCLPSVPPSKRTLRV